MGSERVRRITRRAMPRDEVRIQYGIPTNEVEPDTVASWGGAYGTREAARMLTHALADPRWSALGEELPSVVDELRERGFDLSTFELRVRLRATHAENAADRAEP